MTRRDLDDQLQRFLDEEDATPVAGNRTYVLGKLIAVVERSESLLMEIGASWDPHDPFRRATLVRGIIRIRELLGDIERHLARFEK